MRLPEQQGGEVLLNSATPTPSDTESYLASEVRRVFERPEMPPMPTQQMAEEWLTGWFRYNDLLTPVFHGREAQEDIRIERKSDGTAQLHLPRGLKFAEALSAADVVYRDTYADRPEMLQARRSDQTNEAANFRAAGNYFAMLSGEHKDKTVTKNLQDYAQQFTAIADILDPQPQNSPTERAETELDRSSVERWLLGDKVYESQLTQGRDSEAARSQTITRLFGYIPEASPGFGQQLFARKVAEAIRAGERAANPLALAVYDRGIDMVAHHIAPPDALGSRAATLWEAINLDGMINGLTAWRTNPASAERTIARREKEYATLLMQAISHYDYEDQDAPTAMVATRALNCLGAATILARFLTELGIDHSGLILPRHAVVLVHPADGTSYIADATPPSSANALLPTYRIFDQPLLNRTEAVRSPRPIPFSSAAYTALGLTPEQDWHSYIGDGLSLFYGAAQANLGATRELSDHNAAALASYEESLRVNPANSVTMTEVGNIHQWTMHYPQAIKVYEELLQRGTDNTEIRTSLGESYARLNDYRRAITHYKAALRLDSENRRAQRGLRLARLRRGLPMLRPFLFH